MKEIKQKRPRLVRVEKRHDNKKHVGITCHRRRLEAAVDHETWWKLYWPYDQTNLGS